MIVGALKARLLLRESQTLKDKRQVVKSIKDRIANAFPVSVAEVGSVDDRKIVELGIALATNETHHAKSVLGAIVDALRSHPIAEFLDHEMEVFSP